jgi:hypothetical protein
MASTIAAGTTSGTAIAIAGDTSGVLQLQTNGTTAAVTIDTNQRAAFVAGTALLPAITTTGDTNTGIFFPAADTIAFSEGGTESMRIDSSGNVGIGLTSSGNKFEVSGSGLFTGAVTTNTTGTHISYQSSNSQIGAWGPDASTNGTLVFYSARSNGSNGLERMRVNVDGALLINRTTQANSERLAVTGNTGSQCMSMTSPITGAYDMCNMINGNGQVGVIQTNGSATAYVTSSDYRLKENIAPMTGALAQVALLKPCTYTWKVNGSAGQGFIAHELQAVVPDCVTGEKDAVETYTDKDGNEQTRIKPQGVDTSFLVATLTAAIQELNAKVEAQAVRIAELEGAK